MITLTEEMFRMHAPQGIAQGEVTIWNKKFCPPEILEQAQKGNLVVKKLEKDRLILGHSETGHHHVLEAVRPVHISKVAQALVDETNEIFINLTLHEAAKVSHLRSDDTHGAYMLEAGEYICRPDDESTVEGWRKVAD